MRIAAGPVGQPTRAESLSILIGASVMLSISMGIRQSLGLFMTPVTHDLGITVSDFTFALAIQNIAWGLTQPLVGRDCDLLDWCADMMGVVLGVGLFSVLARSLQRRFPLAK